MTESLFESIPLFGEALLDQGLISEEQLKKLLEQPESSQRLGELAVSRGFLSEKNLAKFLADHFRLPYFDLTNDEEIDLAAVELIPENMARRHSVLVVKKEGEVVVVVLADPLDIRALDAVRFETGCRIRKAVGDRTAILQAIDRFYHAPSRVIKSMNLLLAGENLIQHKPHTAEDSASPIDQLTFEVSNVPVIQFVNLLLMRAIQERASDIHLEPDEQGVTVRFRVDGHLRGTSAPPKQMYPAICIRIKLLSNMDIAERRLPQDGRFRFNAFEKNIDIRVSCLPTVHGEKIVMRILDRSTLVLDMQGLGFESRMLNVFQRTLKLPHGLIIVTGPTGSGKTTSMYSALNFIKSPNKNIVTIEDPVEYQLPNINQVHTKSEIGLTFAAGLRSILRQDPDVIMVGEIRDRETAEICIRAALTGHLVLSTLHTNDAVSAISRLTDMGIEPYLLSATLNLLMSQRLVRRICEDCAERWHPPAELLERLEKSANMKSLGRNFRRGRGCPSCTGTGYRGRVAVYEQFLITEQIRTYIAEETSLNIIRETAKKEGLATLFQSALKKAGEGITALDEVFSICTTQGEVL